MAFAFKASIDPPHNLVHLCLLRGHVGADYWSFKILGKSMLGGALPGWSAFVANVVEAKIVQNHACPVVLVQGGRYISGYIQVHFGEILFLCSQSL